MRGNINRRAVGQAVGRQQAGSQTGGVQQQQTDKIAGQSFDNQALAGTGWQEIPGLNREKVISNWEQVCLGKLTVSGDKRPLDGGVGPCSRT